MTKVNKNTLLIPINKNIFHKNILYIIYINMKKIGLVKVIDNYINDRNFSMIYKNNKLDIINYTKILDFSDTKISINSLDKTYIITGTNLVISKMLDDEVLITGTIKDISFNEMS